MNSTTLIASKLYSEILHLRRNGNLKAGVPEYASEELEYKLNMFFLKQRKSHIEWEHLKREVYNV